MEIEILSHSNFPAADPKRPGQMDTLIIFRVDKKRTDSLLVPGEVTDLKIIQARIADKLKASAPILGHKFNLP